jgi:hypothetical protein
VRHMLLNPSVGIYMKQSVMRVKQIERERDD